MSSIKIFTALCLTFSIASFAGGAASLVGKKAASSERVFSPATQFDFIKECNQNADAELCSCVLDKLQQNYSEDEYLKLDADLRNNKSRPKFTAFINSAVDECSKESPEEATASGVSEKEAKEYVENYFKGTSKEDFVSYCNTNISTILGPKAAQKTCKCSYDHMMANKAKFVQMVMDYGIPGDDDTRWGAENLSACAPEKFTPEIEQNLIAFLNQNSVPLSYSKCIVKVLKKEYTLKSFILSGLRNKAELLSIMSPLLVQCVAAE